MAVSAQDRDTLDMVRDAIRNKRIRLGYQQVVSSKAPDRPAFCEGLLRVLDRKGRVIPAHDFIDVVEQDQMGRQLDVLALETGLAMLGKHPGLRLSINMSARSIGYPQWKQTLYAGLKGDRTIAERLVLEISEDTMIAIPELVQVFMEELHLQGISFALDNFGKTVTSLRHLRDLFFDIIKIDGTFTHDLVDNPDNRAMIKAIVAMAGALETYTVAQKVETRGDAEVLIDLGVDGMQGYFFGAPTLNPGWMSQEMCCKVG